MDKRTTHLICAGHKSYSAVMVLILIGELLAGGFEMTSPISSGWCNAIVAATLEWKQVAGECSLGC